MLESISPFRFIEVIISLAVIQQTIELLQLRRTYSDKGIWQWSILRDEFNIFPASIQKFLGVILEYRNFLGLIYCRLFLAMALLFSGNWYLLAFLLASTILICLRWRGTFNGGSDYMTIIVLGVVLIARLFASSSVLLGCLWYLAIQTSLSYFIAGAAKMRRKNWWTGRALRGFLVSAVFRPSPATQYILNHQWMLIVVSVLIILFELSFPLALLHPHICLAFLALAFMFHLANCYVFGLNRFLFAWAAAYPAVYACSQLH